MTHPSGGNHGNPHDFDGYVKKLLSPERIEWQRPVEVVKAMGISPGSRICEYGVGPGYFTRLLARAAGPSGVVFGADVVPEMLTLLLKHIDLVGAEALPDAPVSQISTSSPEEFYRAPGSSSNNRPPSATLGSLPASRDPALATIVPVLTPDDRLALPPCSLDVVLIANTLHHADSATMLSAAAATLESGGCVFNLDFSPDAPEGTPGPPREMRLSQSHVDAVAENCGLNKRELPGGTIGDFQYLSCYQKP